MRVDQPELNAQEDLRVIANSSSSVIVRLDREARYVFVNHAYERWSGRRLSDVVGQSVFEFVSPLLADAVRVHVSRALQGETITVERELTSVAGLKDFYLVSYLPARAPDQTITGVIVTMQDIGVQKRAEEEAEKRRRELREVFDQAPIPIALLIGPEHVFALANPPYVEFSDRDPVGRALRDVFTEEEAGVFFPLVDEVYSSGRPQIQSEIPIRRLDKNGLERTFLVEVALHPYRGFEGTVVGVLAFLRDVTAQALARERARTGEAWLRSIFAHAAVGFAISDSEGRFVEVNRRFCEITGFRAEDLITRNFRDFIHPGDLSREDEAIGQLLRRERQSFIIEKRFTKKEGGTVWLRSSVSLLPADSGQTYIVHVTEDVTETHEADQRRTLIVQELERTRRDVTQEREKFKAIFAASFTHMAVLKGPDFVYEVVNQSYLNLFNDRELVGKRFIDALPELANQEFPRRAREVYETGVPYKDPEALAFLKRTPEGPIEGRYFDQMYSRVLDDEGRPYGVFIHALEVTDRVLARRAMLEAAERFQIAVEAANMGTWDLNPIAKSVEWSDRTKELFGLPADAKVDLMTSRRMMHPDDVIRMDRALRDATDPNGSGRYDIDYRIRLPQNLSGPNQNGADQIRWVAVRGKSYFQDGPQGRFTARISGTILDITDRVLNEVALRDAKERAEMASAAKSAFLAHMSHEIRTPLGAIMGFVSLMKDEGVSATAVQQYLSIIERNSNQLMRIVDDILDLSKVEAGMMLIETVSFSLIELLSDFASLMDLRARERGIAFTLKAATELPDVIVSDPTRIRQILMNIVGNAIKFTDRGTVEVRVCYREQVLEFRVSDTGRGISPDQAKGLFQAFSQADPSITRKYGGTGLGLVLTRRLSEAMGGRFELVRSELGGGSVFETLIKVGLDERTRFVRALGFAHEAAKPVGVTGQLSGLRILLVEDSLDNQALFTIYLRRAGAEIDIAGDGAKGVELAVNGQYDVVLMDVQMPVMDGITAVRKLRELGYKKPIIALTAHAMKEERVRCLEAGYTSFLSKPIQRATLVEALREFQSQPRD